MSEVIRTDLRLWIGESGKEATADVLPDLLSFSYDDKESGEADEVSLVLKDPDGKWAASWSPEKGQIVKASIVPKGALTLRCGTFYVDSLRTSGSPRVMEIKAVSVPQKTAIRRLQKTKSWEAVSLGEIVQQIASSHEMKALYDVEDDPDYDRVDQKQESDLKFLQRLCEDAGFSLKVTDGRLVVFNQETYEKKAPIETITLGVSSVLSWSFETQLSDSYRRCIVSWRDPKQKVKGDAGSHTLPDGTDSGVRKNPAVMTFTYEDPDGDPDGQDLKIHKRATSQAEAERIAKAELRKANLARLTGSLKMIGSPYYVAGSVIEVAGFGSFDGRFIIERASHSIGSGGYTTDLTLRRVNKEY